MVMPDPDNPQIDVLFGRIVDGRLASIARYVLRRYSFVMVLRFERQKSKGHVTPITQPLF